MELLFNYPDSEGLKSEGKIFVKSYFDKESNGTVVKIEGISPKIDKLRESPLDKIRNLAFERINHQLLKIQDITPQTKESLRFFAIQYLAKVAGFTKDFAKSFHVPRSSIEEKTSYYRQYEHHLLEKLNNCLSEFLGILPESVFTVNDLSVI